MKIEHIALWTKDLEGIKQFYVEFFEGIPGDKYFNPKKNFTSYFIRFTSGARLEIMEMPSIPLNVNDVEKQYTGLIHMAFSVGSREKVDSLTERLRDAGYRIDSEPRYTGDGYYESCVLDPDGNRIEITI